jgi:hypothetical protein
MSAHLAKTPASLHYSMHSESRVVNHNRSEFEAENVIQSIGPQARVAAHELQVDSRDNSCVLIFVSLS